MLIVQQERKRYGNSVRYKTDRLSLLRHHDSKGAGLMDTFAYFVTVAVITLAIFVFANDGQAKKRNDLFTSAAYCLTIDYTQSPAVATVVKCKDLKK